MTWSELPSLLSSYAPAACKVGERIAQESKLGSSLPRSEVSA